jgi:hypothetical protein
MSTPQLLQDVNFSDLSPHSVPNPSQAVIVQAPSRLGSWSVDFGFVALASPQFSLISPYNGSLPNDPRRYIVSLARGNVGVLSQSVPLPRAGTLSFSAYFLRKPSAGPSGSCAFGLDIVRELPQQPTVLSQYGKRLELGTTSAWQQLSGRFPVGRSGAAYARLVGGLDTAGEINGGVLVTTVSLYYPYDAVGKLTSPTGGSGSVSTAVNTSFPQMQFFFTENNPDPNNEANANNALPNSTVIFSLKNGSSGIQFATSDHYQTMTDGNGNATIPAGTLIAGPNGGASDQLLAYVGTELTGVVATLSVTGGKTPPPPTTKYQFVWKGATGPLQLAANGTGTAIFQLQTTDGTPVPGQQALLLASNQNGTTLQFADGTQRYLSATDPAGNISSLLLAGSVAGSGASVIALLVSDSSVTLTEPVVITAATPPQTNYKFVWEGAQNPLQIAQNGTGTAAFQLQTDTGTPVPNMGVFLSAGNPNGTNLQFTGGQSHYAANTDGSGNISAGMLAGNVPGDANVLALLTSNFNVSLQVGVQITQATPPQTQYKLVWQGATDPLTIPQGGMGRAVFQLQDKNTGTPVPQIPVTLTIAPAATGLQFTDTGTLTYANSTDASGNISAAMTAGNGTGNASVTAALPSDASVSATETVQIVQGDPTGTVKYVFSWAEGTGTLNIPQHQRGTASFLLRTADTLEPVPQQLVQLNLAGLGLTFVMNNSNQYFNYTDQSGGIAALVQATDQSGSATITASTPAGGATPYKAPITVTPLRLPDDAEVAPARKSAGDDPGL